MSGSGHSQRDVQSVNNVTQPRPIGRGEWWSEAAFQDFFTSVVERELVNVIDYNVHLDSDKDVYNTHEIYAGPDGMVYFTQSMHDRVGRLTLDGRVELFELPKGSYPHGIRFSEDGRLYVTLEDFDQIVELSKRDGSIITTYSVAFDNPQTEGVVGPHGFAIDPQGKLWYTGRTSDVLGWVDPATGEHRRFELPTRAAIAPNFNHDAIKPAASAPINIEFDQVGNAWFVNLQTNQIGRIDLNDELSLFEIEGFGTDNTRPINIYQGPEGFIWVTIEGDNSPELVGSQQSLGGIARFDPASETFTAYPQTLSKGAGGVVGVKPDSVWFQYQENDLVRLDVDESGRRDQTVFPLPDIGSRNRVMHRIGQGPDGSMWFTSLNADLVSQIATEEQGLPVYSFDASSTRNQYLSSVPQEWTLLLSESSGAEEPDPLFLSTADLSDSVSTSRFRDQITGQTVWTADPTERFIWSQSFRYQYIAEDFRVFDEIDDAQNLIPVYRTFDDQARVFRWYVDPLSVDSADHASANIAWFAHAIPDNAMYG